MLRPIQPRAMHLLCLFLRIDACTLAADLLLNITGGLDLPHEHDRYTIDVPIAMHCEPSPRTSLSPFMTSLSPFNSIGFHHAHVLVPAHKSHASTLLMTEICIMMFLCVSSITVYCLFCTHATASNLRKSCNDVHLFSILSKFLLRIPINCCCSSFAPAFFLFQATTLTDPTALSVCVLL